MSGGITAPQQPDTLRVYFFLLVLGLFFVSIILLLKAAYSYIKNLPNRESKTVCDLKTWLIVTFAFIIIVLLPIFDGPSFLEIFMEP